MDDPLLSEIAQTIFNKKGFSILVLDMRPISSLTDYVIIAEGNINKHVQAIGEALIEFMKKRGQQISYVEGMREGDWVVLDFSEIVVHLFQPGWRDQYNLEALWKDAQIVDVRIDTEAAASIK